MLVEPGQDCAEPVTAEPTSGGGDARPGARTTNEWPSLPFSRLRKVVQRLASNFYDRADVRDEIARRAMADLPPDEPSERPR